MNLFPLFQAVLYTISTALLYPVVVFLILLCLLMAPYSGGILAEWVQRRKNRPGGLLADHLSAINEKGRLPEKLTKGLPLHIGQFAEDLAGILAVNDVFLEERIEDLLQRRERLLWREVVKIRLVVRIGPSLGLMGTLIPMGTGLAGLSQGNMAQLSSNLILAFTTTVVGLALGILAHVFSMIKERWTREDIFDIRLLAEAMSRGRVKTAPRL